MNSFKQYSIVLQHVLASQEWDGVRKLAEAMREAWRIRKRIYLCGNGGSAANAMHLANDYNYGIAKDTGMGLRVVALPANSSVITCLANDISYDDIFSQQIAVQGEPGDILIVLSGSGNSPNVIKALDQAKKIGMKTFAVLGYSGGKCKQLADVAIHVQVDDMQIAEDMQLIIGHMITRWLRENPV